MHVECVAFNEANYTLAGKLTSERSTDLFDVYFPHVRAQVVTLEQPELEERHLDLITSIATDQKQLLDIEDQILRLLNEASSGVEVLDDEVCSYTRVRVVRGSSC